MSDPMILYFLLGFALGTILGAIFVAYLLYKAVRANLEHMEGGDNQRPGSE